MSPETAKWAASLPHPDDTAAWDARLREVFAGIGFPVKPEPVESTGESRKEASCPQ